MSSDISDGITVSPDYENWHHPEFGTCPSLPATVAGLQTRLILDTGAEFSFVSQGQIDRWESQERSLRVDVERDVKVHIFTGFDEVTARTDKYAKIPVYVGARRYLWKFAVIKGRVDYVLLGIDFLNNFARSMTFADRRVGWRDAPRSLDCFRENVLAIVYRQLCENQEIAESVATDGESVDERRIGSTDVPLNRFHRMLQVGFDRGLIDSDGTLKLTTGRLAGSATHRDAASESSEERDEILDRLNDVQEYMDEDTALRFRKAKIRHRAAKKRAVEVKVKLRAAISRLLDEYEWQIVKREKATAQMQQFIDETERLLQRRERGVACSEKRPIRDRVSGENVIQDVSEPD